jgi:predicted amidohydrolase
MQDLTITLIQTHQHWEDKQKNLAHFEAHLATLNQPTDLIIFPEMFHTGFTMNAKGMAEDMNGEGITWLTSVARTHQSAVVASLIIEEQGKYFNRMVFITPDGQIQHYDKRKLFTLAHEQLHYTAGKSNVIVSFKGWKILLQVCYDLRFPEQCRNRVTEDGEFLYDLLLYVANWPERRSHHWSTLITARAIENQCFVAAVNRVGTDANQLDYSGDSMIVDALGIPLVHERHEEKVRTIRLSKNELVDVRAKLAFLKDA